MLAVCNGSDPAVLAAATATGFPSTADILDRMVDVVGTGQVNVRFCIDVVVTNSAG